MEEFVTKASNFDVDGGSAALRLGVLGGTFDPIHVGHVAMARQARREFNLDRVIVLVSGSPPHKRTSARTCERLAMAQLALEDEQDIELSRLEADRPGQTYAVDSLRALSALYPGSELFYVIGADTLLDLPTWREAGAVSKLCEFIVFYRHGAQLPKAEAILESLPDLRFGVAQLNVPDVSSTEIRARVKGGASIRGLVNPAVETYIRKNGLYR